MTPSQLTDAQIRDAFDHRVGEGLPSDLRSVILTAVASQAQGRNWIARPAAVLSRPEWRRGALALAAIVLLVAAAVAIALVGNHDQPDGSGRGTVFISGGDVYVAGLRGDNPRLVVGDLPGVPSRLTWVDVDAVVLQSEPGGVYAVDLDAPVARLLMENGQLLALSPDHLRVAIGLDRPDGPHLSIVEIASGLQAADIVVEPASVFPARPQIGPQGGLAGGPNAWSPDGRWLLGQGFGTDASATSGWIYQLDVQTGEIRDLVTDLCCGLEKPNPVLSPNGSRVVFVNYHEAYRDQPCGWRCGTLWSFELATGARTQLTPEAGSEIGPVFSPDGNWIAFLYNAAGDGFEVAVVRPDGTGLRTLTHAADRVTHAADAFAPSANLEPYRYLFWDANGTGLTFMRGPGEAHELWHVTLDGLVEQRLGTFFVSEFAR